MLTFSSFFKYNPCQIKVNCFNCETVQLVRPGFIPYLIMWPSFFRLKNKFIYTGAKWIPALFFWEINVNIRFFLVVLSALLVFACQPYISSGPQPGATPKVRVLIAEIVNPDTVAFSGVFSLAAEEATYTLGKRNNWLKITISANGFRLSNPNRIFSFRNGDRITITPEKAAHYFSLNGLSYRGQIVLVKPTADKLYFINRLGVEDYLLGVVPSEMPATKNEYFQALKAQAICARTYTLKKMLKRKAEMFDVYASVKDQAYRGLSAERPLSTKALSETRGDVLMFKDSLATIYYSSTCGGLSEAAQNYWPGQSASYLQSAPDALGDEFACTVSPHFRWQRSFTINQLDTLFRNQFGFSRLHKPVRDTTNIHFEARVLSRSTSFRVQKMALTYADTTVFLQNFEIRRFFNLPRQGMLKSNLFAIDKSDNHLIFYGGGYGHGVGLCQWGALNMSQKGFKYYDILVNKYFKGTYLKKVY